MDTTMILGAGGFLVMLILLAVFRVKTGGKYEIKTSDIALALVPLVLLLLQSGKIKELTIGDVKIVLNAVEEASNASVQPQITKLPIEAVRADPKGGLMEIPSLLKKKSQALGFKLRYGGYYGPAVMEYLEALTQSTSFKYVVINNPDGSFYGMIDGRQLYTLMRGQSAAHGGDEFAQAVNNADTSQLGALPGILRARDALTTKTNIKDALQALNTLDVQTLPALDEQGTFIGVVDRSKLSASMLLEIAQKLEGQKK